MYVNELTRGQKSELKQKYYDELLMKMENRNISYGEIANIDDIISDEEIENAYGNVVFTNDDFFTNDRNEDFE